MPEALLKVVLQMDMEVIPNRINKRVCILSLTLDDFNDSLTGCTVKDLSFHTFQVISIYCKGTSAHSVASNYSQAQHCEKVISTLFLLVHFAIPFLHLTL